MIDAYTFDMVRFKESDESTKYFHTCVVCGETGTTEFYADDLGNVVYKEAISDSKYQRTEADCTTKESYWYSCTCGESSEGKANEAYFEVGETLGHSFEFDGDTATCSVCGHVCVHEYEEGTTNCKYCNIEKPVVACQHTTTEPVSGKDATCTETGLTAGTRCVDCGEMVQEQTEIPVDENAHDWNDGVVTTDPTCSVPGVKTFTCKHNSEHTKTEPVDIDATAHKWTDADCDTPKTCSLCGYTEGAELGHNYEATYDTASHYELCSRCQATRNSAAHSYDDDNDATCNGCGYVREIEGDDPGTGEEPTTNSKHITSIGESITIDVKGTFVDREDFVDETPIYTVYVEWDTMTFEYVEAADIYEWNPDTLQYDFVSEGEESGWVEYTAKIRIENRSNAPVLVKAEWVSEDGVDISPEISAAVRLESAVGCVGTGTTGEIRVSNPTEGSISDDCVLGKIVLTIEAVADDIE